MLVGLLTLEQKEQLDGQYYTEDIRFNPIQDADGDWIISTQEMFNCINPDLIWVKDLPLIDWQPIEI